jgi:CelD/BcsL family acetyltransferase involved in cellulose biosynthesis
MTGIVARSEASQGTAAGARALNPADLRITVCERFEEIESRWRNFEAEADCFAFQRFAWLATWQRCVGATEGIAPVLVWVEDEAGRPLMLLPLGLKRRRGIARLIWLGGPLSDYLAPLLSPDWEQRLSREGFLALWRAIECLLPPFDALCLERQPEYIQGKPNPMLWLGAWRHPSSAHVATLSGNFEAFLRDRHGAGWLGAERRKERRLANAGRLAFVVADGSNAAPLLEAMIVQKSAHYRALGVKDLFAGAHRDFVRTLTDEQIETGFVRLFALTLDDRVIASHWGLVDRDRFYYMLPAYQRGEIMRYSPGRLLLRHMLRWSMERGLRFYDFTVGDEPYKREWSDRELRLFDRYAGRTPRGRLYCTARRLTGTMKGALKRRRLLWELGKKLRARLAQRHRA